MKKFKVIWKGFRKEEIDMQVFTIYIFFLILLSFFIIPASISSRDNYTSVSMVVTLGVLKTIFFSFLPTLLTVLIFTFINKIKGYLKDAEE